MPPNPFATLEPKTREQLGHLLLALSQATALQTNRRFLMTRRLIRVLEFLPMRFETLLAGLFGIRGMSYGNTCVVGLTTV